MPVKDGTRYAIFNYYYTVKNLQEDFVAEKFAPLVPADFKLNA